MSSLETNYSGGLILAIYIMLNFIEVSSLERNYSGGLILAKLWVQRGIDNDYHIDIVYVHSCISKIDRKSIK